MTHAEAWAYGISLVPASRSIETFSQTIWYSLSHTPVLSELSGGQPFHTLHWCMATLPKWDAAQVTKDVPRGMWWCWFGLVTRPSRQSSWWTFANLEHKVLAEIGSYPSKQICKGDSSDHSHGTWSPGLGVETAYASTGTKRNLPTG